MSHQAAALIRLIESQPKDTLAELKEAIILNSGGALNYAYMGAALAASGRAGDAISHIRTAMRLDPHYPPLFDYIRGAAHFVTDNFEEAASAYADATRRNPSTSMPSLGSPLPTATSAARRTPPLRSRDSTA